MTTLDVSPSLAGPASPEVPPATPERHVGGACAEIARRLNAPVGFVRSITFIVLVLLPYGFLAYLGLVLLLPQRGRRWPGVANLFGALRFGVFFAAPFVLLTGALNLQALFDQSPAVWLPQAGVVAAIFIGLLVPPPGADSETYERHVVMASAVLLAIAAMLFAGVVLVPALRWERVVAGAATLSGVALALASRRFDLRAWILPIATAAAGLLLLTASGARLQGGVGDRNVRVTQVGALRHSYRRAIGALTVNLSGLNTHGRTVNLVLTVGIGHLSLIFPAGADIEVDARIGRGQINSSAYGLNPGLDLHRRLTGTSAFAHPTVRLHVVAEVGIGTLEIQRVGGAFGRGEI